MRAARSCGALQHLHRERLIHRDDAREAAIQRDFGAFGDLLRRPHAPVTVGRGAVIAAGSTITQDVPADALAITRATQVNRPGWATRRRALQQDAVQVESGSKKTPAAPKVKSVQRIKRR